MNREKMFAMIRSWQQSGQNLSAYARSQGISYQKLSYWRRQFQKHQAQGLEADPLQADEAPAFTDLRPEDDHRAKPTPQVEIHFPSGARVVVAQSEVAFIRQLVQG